MQVPPRNPLDLLRARPELHGWIAVNRQTIRHELYFLSDRTEARRRCEEAGGTITLLVRKGDLIGKSGFDVTPDSEALFPRLIDEAVFRARLGGEPAYPLPGKGPYMKVHLLDPGSREDPDILPRRARSDILAGLSGVSGVRLASGEFFISKTRTSVVTSAGAAAENDESRYYVDIVLLAGPGTADQERHVTVRRRRYEDLNLAAVVAREAGRARDRLAARLPGEGGLPVLLGPEVLGEFWAFLVQATSAEAIHRRASPYEVGRPIHPPEDWAGDPLVLELNALFPFGPASYRIDEQGVAGRNVRVIDNGMFATPHGGPQFAHYLKLPEPTGAPGTPQLPPGKVPEADLRAGDHIEIVELSDVVPSLESGRFSGEIRFAYEVRGGRRRPVAGGVLSGEIPAALAHARYSLEVGLHDTYVGPNVALIEAGLVTST